jgi:uncharacterized membrane protein
MPLIHPALVHFPIALTVTAVIADTVAVAAGIPSLLPVGGWTIAIAAAGAVVAAIAGYVDMKRNTLADETHEIVHLHMKSGIALASALILVAAWRWALEAPSTGYLMIGWILVAAVALQAWLGGEIVYAHGGGVAAAGQGPMPESEAKKPSRRFIRLLTGKGNSTEHQ